MASSKRAKVVTARQVIRKMKDKWRVAFCIPKGYETTGSARHCWLYLPSKQISLLTKKLNAKPLPVWFESGLILLPQGNRG